MPPLLVESKGKAMEKPSTFTKGPIQSLNVTRLLRQLIATEEPGLTLQIHDKNRKKRSIPRFDPFCHILLTLISQDYTHTV